MLMTESIASNVAEFLLEIKAVKLQPNNPFTWASGWKSPIYCDNRKTLSYPKIRTTIRDYFSEIIKAKYPSVEVIAGVATGGIAQGVLVAEALNLPFIYVRSSAKGHGLQNKIEGYYEPGQKVVVIEDLISTGMSSLDAVEALRAGGCKVLGMGAIFTYGFETATQNFAKYKCDLFTLSNFNILAKKASELNYISESDIKTLGDWRKAPESWKK